MCNFRNKVSINEIAITFIDKIEEKTIIKEVKEICKEALDLLKENKILEYLQLQKFEIKIIREEDWEKIDKCEKNKFKDADQVKNKFNLKNKLKNLFTTTTRGKYFYGEHYIYYAYDAEGGEKTILHEIGHYLDYIFGEIKGYESLKKLNEYIDKEDEIILNKAQITEENKKCILHRSLNKEFISLYYKKKYKLYFLKNRHYKKNIREFFAVSFARYIIHNNNSIKYKSKRYTKVFKYIESFINDEKYKKSKDELLQKDI